MQVSSSLIQGLVGLTGHQKVTELTSSVLSIARALCLNILGLREAVATNSENVAPLSSPEILAPVL